MKYKGSVKTYGLRCLLCNEWRPKALFGVVNPGLVAVQEHAMQMHGVTQREIQHRDMRRNGALLIYHLPDGTPWLEAHEHIENVPTAVETFIRNNPGMTVADTREFILDQIKRYNNSSLDRRAPVERWLAFKLGCSSKRNVATAMKWASSVTK